MQKKKQNIQDKGHVKCRKKVSLVTFVKCPEIVTTAHFNFILTIC